MVPVRRCRRLGRYLNSLRYQHKDKRYRKGRCLNMLNTPGPPRYRRRDMYLLKVTFLPQGSYSRDNCRHRDPWPSKDKVQGT